MHPLFLLVGVWYAVTGELFLFLLSALVAIQHECAHAFAAAQGYAPDFSDERRHHEIYLSDPRKTEPAKMRTVVRHPIRVA